MKEVVFEDGRVLHFEDDDPYFMGFIFEDAYNNLTEQEAVLALYSTASKNPEIHALDEKIHQTKKESQERAALIKEKEDMLFAEVKERGERNVCRDIINDAIWITYAAGAGVANAPTIDWDAYDKEGADKDKDQ